MAEIRAFRASRFTEEAGELASLLAPRSETVSSDARELLAAHPHNLVHATLPPSDADDRSKFVRYARASAQLSGLRRNRSLATDSIPALYGLDRDGITVGLIGLVRASDVQNDGESAPVKAREDRLRLLEATRTHLEPITVRTGRIDFESLLSGGGSEIVATASVEDATWTLSAISDPGAISQVALALDAAELSATGAGYEAAVAFRAGLGERDGTVAEDFLLAEIVGEDGGASAPSGFVLWGLGEFV